MTKMRDELHGKCAGCGKKCEMYVPGPSVCKSCHNIIARVESAQLRVKYCCWLYAADAVFKTWTGFTREEGMDHQLIATLNGWA